MRVTLRSLLASSSLALAVTVASVTAPGAAHASPSSISTACGSPLSSSEIKKIVALSDTSTITGDTDLEWFDKAVERNRQITEILVGHRDWRGLVMVGLDTVERKGLVPLQHDPKAFKDPEFGHAFSPDLLKRFLVNVHHHFLGKPTEKHWARYFELAHKCDASQTQVAMAGYNAHLGVDVSNALSDVHAGLQNLPDYFKVTATVVNQGDAIMAATKEAYGTETGAVWKLVIAASPAICTVAFVNGVGLQSPVLAGVIRGEMTLLWRATDFLVAVLTG